MKKIKFLIPILLLFLLILPFLFQFILSKKHTDFIAEHFGFRKNEFTIIEESDTHSGLHGDGSYSLILDCSTNKEKALETIKDWKELPLSENLQLLMYGGERNDAYNCYNLAEEAKIPELENGYYYFYDRNSYSTDSTDDSNIFRNSFNFSISLYDTDTDIMYFFEYDT